MPLTSRPVVPGHTSKLALHGTGRAAYAGAPLVRVQPRQYMTPADTDHASMVSGDTPFAGRRTGRATLHVSATRDGDRGDDEHRWKAKKMSDDDATVIDDSTADRARAAVDHAYRTESRRAFATLIRLLGDFDLAEEALHDAFRAALEQWPRDGVPANPRAWLVSTGRFKAIDGIRRRARFEAPLPDSEGFADEADDDAPPFAERGAALEAAVWDDANDAEELEDDRLRLVFTCCYPALPPDAQVALTLREVCGLTTEEIARAFLTSPATLAQRIVRAKTKIRDARIPYRCADARRIAGAARRGASRRLPRIQRGLLGSAGATLTRHDLSGEAIRLARLLLELLPQREPEANGVAGADAAARGPAHGAHVGRRRTGAARRTGPRAVEPRADRRGRGTGAARAGARGVLAPTRCRQRSPQCTPRQRRPRRPMVAHRRSSTTCSPGVDPSPVVELNRAAAVYDARRRRPPGSS